MDRAPGRNAALREDCKAAGAEISIGGKEAIGWVAHPPELAWLARFSVPFSYAASKNHIFAMRSRGHVALRTESRSLRDRVEAEARRAIQGVAIVQNKVWVDLFVEKPNHKGDAINILDLVADGIKRGIGVDDRWFSIRQLDWSIQKNDPMIFIGVGQEAVGDAQACSTCGRVLPFGMFTRNASTATGVGRICSECRRAGAKLSRRRRRDAAA